MTRILRGITVVVLFAFVVSTPAIYAQERKGSRLVVDNRTKQPAMVEIWHFDGKTWAWRQVATVSTGQWVPVYNVKDGERLRATLGRGPVRYHKVQLKSGQDVWWLDG
jgi:hypothetical protein